MQSRAPTWPITVRLERVAETVEPVAEIAEGPYLADTEVSQACASAASSSAWPGRPRPGPVVEEPDETDAVLQQLLDRMESDAVVLLAPAADGHVGEPRDGAVVAFHHQDRLVRQVFVGPVLLFVPPDTGPEFILGDGIAVRHTGELLVVEVRQDGRLVEFEGSDFHGGWVPG